MSLDKHRKEIDRLDAQIVKLLNERTQCALEIGKIKKETGAEIYVPSREKAVFDRVHSLNDGPLTDQSLVEIYREIMSAALSLEHELKIAYLGPAATFTHQAARARFGGSVQYTPCSTITDVFNFVEGRSVDYGVVPVENSIEGAVTNTFDQFVDTGVKICAEIYLPISLNLLSKVPLREIKRIYSKKEAIGQCRRWLNENLPGVVQIPVESTSKAAQLVVDERDGSAIASSLAAEMYDLKKVAENIQDSVANTTRFLVLGQNYSPASGNDKTSIMFSIRHQAGSLHDALRGFHEANVNMTKIESRPNKRRGWEYNFFVDFVGHADDPKIRRMLDDLAKNCTLVKVLGSYPNAMPED